MGQVDKYDGDAVPTQAPVVVETTDTVAPVAEDAADAPADGGNAPVGE